jgi:hypothetical protein
VPSVGGGRHQGVEVDERNPYGSSHGSGWERRLGPRIVGVSPKALLGSIDRRADGKGAVVCLVVVGAFVWGSISGGGGGPSRLGLVARGLRGDREGDARAVS